MEVHAGEVGVFVRVRPTKDFAKDLIECFPDEKKVIIYQRKDCRNPAVRNQQSSLSFQLDGVLQDVPQEEVYTHVARQVVLGALDGYNGNVMCFGQTGSGKSYTMVGSTEQYKKRGIIPRALQEVFREVERRSERVFFFHLSYLEIHNENLVDLLSLVEGSTHPPVYPMVVTEKPGGGVLVRGLSLHPVCNEMEALALFFEGEMNRISGSHALNRNSSRSHCIFALHIESSSRETSDAIFFTSKLNLVDLAGSDRVGKTRSGGQAIKEAMYINKSLLFLEQAILALAEDRRDHVPFRQSKLTHALKDSLGGNCNTVLVANIYGEAAHIKETLSTLRFAGRMKCVKTDPVVNQHVDLIALNKILQKELDMLKEERSRSFTLGISARAIYESLSEAQQAEMQSQVEQYLDGSLREISILSVGQVQAVFAQFKLVVQELEQKMKAQLRQTHDVVGKKRNNNSAALKDPKGGTFELGVDAQTQARQTPRTTVWFQDTPSFPPSKAKAFEDFKVGPGREPNRVLEESNAKLQRDRADHLRLTKMHNDIKEKVDHIRALIQQEKDLSARHGQHVASEGEPLHEPGAALVLYLRKLKEDYQQEYVALCITNVETNYCQHLVDQCRVRLLSEFEVWYQEARPEEELDETPTQEEDDRQLQSDLDGDSPGAICFYSARQLMLERRNRRTSVHRVSSGGSRQRKDPTALPAP